MYYYDYRPYLTQINDNISDLNQNILDVYTRLDNAYTLLAVLLAAVVGILAYLMIKNWRFKK